MSIFVVYSSLGGVLDWLCFLEFDGDREFDKNENIPSIKYFTLLFSFSQFLFF